MDSSLTLKFSFIALPICVVAWASLHSRSKSFLAGSALIMLFSAGLALSGFLSDFAAIPPRLISWLIPLAILTVIVACSPIGNQFRSLSYPWLIGFQAFRFPLEVMIYYAVLEGVAPPQFTWTGLNFDVLVGLTALVLFPLASQVPKWVICGWNILGLLLLANIVIVATLSTPGPLQLLTPDNRWIAYFPFIWLPSICVMAALFGHVILFRKLLLKRSEPARSA